MRIPTKSEAELVFYADVREKKRIGSNVHAKTGMRGYVGTMRFAHDLMSRKEKYNHRKAGKVVVSNMYETIIPINEFELKDEQTQKNMLIRWREIYSNKKIQDEMKLSNTLYYNLIDKLEIPKKPRLGEDNNKSIQKPKKKRNAKVKATSPEPTENKQTLLNLDIKEEKPVEVKPVIITRGLHLEYNGEYDVEQLSKMFTKLQLLIDGDTNKYKIRISLSEIEND